jgi:hypothetical protein
MIAALTLTLALSAVVIGSARAADRPDNRAGIGGIGSQSTDPSDVFTRAVARAHAAPVRPDDRAGLRGVGTPRTSTPVAHADVFERAVLRHNASIALRPDDSAGLRRAALASNARAATAGSAGFHWADAGFGAAATLALILILAGLAIARASHHRSHAILD